MRRSEMFILGSGILLVVTGILLLIYSVFATTKEFNYVRDTIKEQIYPVKMNTYLKINCGPLSFFAVKTICRFIPEIPEAINYITDIQQVQVGVYEIQEFTQSGKLKIPGNIETLLRKSGWEMFISVMDKDDNVNCFYKQTGENSMGFFIIVLEKSQLVVVEVSGILDRILEKIIQDKTLLKMH